MAKKKKRSKTADGAISWLCGGTAYESLCVSGYTRLSDNPEVQMAVNYIAELISSMTVCLMRNSGNGDIRVKNELSKKIDIYPNQNTTRKNWMFNIVRNMLLYGNQTVFPKTRDGYLETLEPLSPTATTYLPNGTGYLIQWNGKIYKPEEILHFMVNPDPEYPWKGMGYRAALKDVVHNLKQAAATKKSFMESKWKPSVIVKVDSLTEEFSSPLGRKKLLDEYISTGEAGEPWLIPANQFEVTEIKPLSLNDLALNDAVTLDKRTVAGIIGVPPHVVGAGNFQKEEHRNFINTKIMPIAQIVEQELTRKLLISPDMYFRLSPTALYGYDMEELSNVGQELYVRGIMTGNEVRQWLNLPPMDGLDERVILENYIPAGMIGDQKKLIQKEGEK